MARRWDDKDANGNQLTDGRVCLVIEPDDPTLPAIRTYGRDKDEVLDKLAVTTETGQATIHRLRSAAPAQPSPSKPAVVATRGITADEQARATADLSNPAKAPDAIKTLLRGAGVDVDQMRFREDTNRMALIAQEWERSHPGPIWSDARNQRLLIDTAVLHFNFRRNITAEALDAAHEYLVQRDMLFTSAPSTEVPPDGNRDSRTDVRNATSYRAGELRAPAQVVGNKKAKYTRAEIDGMNTKVYREKLENEAGFAELVNQYAATPVGRTA